MFEDDYYEKALQILRSIRNTVNDEQKVEFERILAEYMSALKSNKDHEGKQIFYRKDYKN